MTSLRAYAPLLSAALTASAAAVLVATAYAPTAPVQPALPTVVFAPHVADPADPVAAAIDALESRLSTPVRAAAPRTHVASPAPVAPRTHVKVTPKPRTHAATSPAPVAPVAPVAAVPAVDKATPSLPGGSLTSPTDVADTQPSPTYAPGCDYNLQCSAN